MKRLSKIVFILVIFCSFVLVNTVNAEKKEVKKVFAKKGSITISTVSGDCNVRSGKGDKIVVRLIYTYSEDSFKPEFLEVGDTLILKEKFYGSCSGMSEWNITAPPKTEIKFKSASGDFTIRGMKGSVSAKTASGDISGEKIEGGFDVKSASGDVEVEYVSGGVEIKTASGEIKVEDSVGDLSVSSASGDIEARRIKGEEIELKTASGDIEVKDSNGNFEVKSASGDVDAKGVELKGASEFKTASGEIYVKLAVSSKFDLTLASASGDAVLDYGENPVIGYFEFVARADRGRIDSPIKFDKEEEFYHYGQKYMRKSFKRKSDTPRIYIKTASGKAELRKD